ncbi:hypothetical protein M0805_007207 [Coniferiporia weirii]|nr:hypothetical protein M0805_007207 [Coniferiporia weirii]
MASARVLAPGAHDPLTKAISELSSRKEEFKATLLNLSPLVSVDRIKDHLVFIGAWARFYQEAEDSDTLAALLSRGVHRLGLWLERVVPNTPTGISGLKPCELPPFDVAMILHACMLSPRRYYEDGLTRFPQLLAIGSFPLKDIAALIDPKTYLYKATFEQVKYWEKFTGVPFDPLRCKGDVHEVTIKCPSCKNELNVLWENDGRGYGESGFLSTCSHCHSSLSRDSLCMAKLIDDLTNFEKSDDVTMRGTLLNDRGDVELTRGRLITLYVSEALRREAGCFPVPTEINISTVFKNLTYSGTNQLKQTRAADLLRPYTQATPFTHDLVKAVTNLAKFHMDIMNAGGCNPSFLNGPCSELDEACEKYNAFLELTTFLEDNGSAVPSPDLDLVWHTHQLEGHLYRENVIALTGIYTDHVSSSENPEFFDEASKETNKQWNERFANVVPLHNAKLTFKLHVNPDNDVEVWTPRLRPRHRGDNSRSGPKANCGTTPKPDCGTAPKPDCGTAPKPVNCGTAPKADCGTASKKVNCGTAPKADCGTAPKPDCGTAPKPDCGTAPKPANCGTAPKADCGTASKKANCGTAPKADCGTAPKPDCGTAPKPDCGTAPKPANCGTAPKADCGTASKKANCGTAPKVNCGTAPKADCGTAPKPDCGTAPKPDCGTAPKADRGTA